MPSPIRIVPLSTGAPIAYNAAAYGLGQIDVPPANNNWLTASDVLNPASPFTMTPNPLSISVNPVGLSPGQYSGFITPSKVNGSTLSQRVFVLLNVFPSEPTPEMPDCGVSTGTPPVYRYLGLTELQGDLLVTCRAETAWGRDLTTDVKVTFNADVTARVTEGRSDALLLVNEPRPPFAPEVPSSVYRGEQLSSKSLLFRNVVVPTGSSSIATLRITNLIVAAGKLERGSDVKAIVSMPGASLRDSDQITGVSAGFPLNYNAGSFLPIFTSTPTRAPINNVIIFTEGFASAFKKRNISTSEASRRSQSD